MIVAGANRLEANKKEVDELNVFPVPDGDTGTNMSLTVMSAAREVLKAGDDASVALKNELKYWNSSKSLF